MYEFARGPLVWVAFAVFFFGSLYRLFYMITKAKKDKVVYPYMSAKFGLRSIFHWIIPLASRNTRLNPGFTILSYLFHLCLLITPIFVLGHILLIKESWGFGWWTLPESLANFMTFLVIITGVIFILRRIVDPTVRYVTGIKEHLLILLVLAPFVTGAMAYYQVFDYKTVITIHMLSGELWLIAIPITWLSHMFYFPFTRSYMGSEFGFVRNARDW